MADRRHPELWRGLELFGLCGVAVAQPLYQVFGASPEVFVFADATGRDIVAFGLVLLLVPPLLLWGIGGLVGVVAPGARVPVHLGSLGLLGALLAVYVAKHLGWPPGPLLAGVGLGVGVLVVWAYRAWGATATLLRFLAVGAMSFLVSFLAFSSTGELLRPTNADAASITVDEPAQLPPVVMVVFDEWPLTSIVGTDGRIDAELYPNLAALAGDATWYPNTTTVTNSTVFAVPSVLTGQMPDADLGADARSHPQNLFTLLASVYDLQAVESVTRLCPAALCTEPEAPATPGARDANRGGTTDAGRRESSLASLLEDARGVYRTLVSPSAELGASTDLEEAESDAARDDAAPVVDEPAVDEPVRDAREDDATADILAIFDPLPEGLNGLLGTLHRDEAPTVHFLHMLLPHTPYAHLPTGEPYTSIDGLSEVGLVQGDDPAGNVRGPAQQAADFDRYRMLLQAGYADRLVGHLLRRLHRTALYDDALVVVTADHGITFEAGAPVRGLGPLPVAPATMPDMAWVPLIVKAPGQTEGRVDDRNAQSIDVLPTIADHLGIQIPWEVDGRSLVGRPRRGGRKPFVRAIGVSGATYRFDQPIDIEDQASLDQVIAGGVDTFLPRGTGRARWYAFGPAPELIGRRVAGLPVGPPSALGPARLDTGRTIEVRPDHELPALAAGRVAGPPPDGTRVAVAVDGRVAAVVPLYTDGTGPGRLAAMLARPTLTTGQHDLELYEVVDGAGPELRPIRLE